MYDLANFSLRDMTALGSVLRRLGRGAHSMEEVANRVVRHLYEQLVTAEDGAPGCVLVRFFKTHRYDQLEPEQQAFAREVLHGEEPAPTTKCLTLLATAGDRPEWNLRQASVAHKAIPLASEELVSQAPMISSLLQQLGIEVGALLSSAPELLVESEASSFNVFHVPDATRSPYIPHREEFVEPAGVRSVLGFGGMLPRGDIFTVILFSRPTVPRETAELFRTLALDVKIAVLPFDEGVFAPGPGSAAAADATDAGVARLKARLGTLEQMLEVYERSVLEQADKLYAEQERIRFQNTLLECQGEASLDGILSVSVDGIILFANRRLAEMWRVPPLLPGTKSYELVLRDMAERTIDPAGFREGAVDLGSGDERQDEVVLRDGRTFDRYTAPISSQDGRHFGRVWHFRDITAFKEIGRMKDEFVSAVSHDLRTPITSIRGALDLIVNGVAGEPPAPVLSLTRLARENCERLMRLIDDVLDIQRMAAGRMELHLELLDLAPLVEKAVASIRPYGERLDVGFEIETTTPGALAHVDADRVMQVMENLLSNAAKFSPAGSRVRVALERRNGTLRVSVRDEGPGIPLEFQSRVFDRFTQAPPSNRRSQGGTGLGLNIARAIVEQLGGTIGFSSEPGAGTTFFFELPAWRAPEE